LGGSSAIQSKKGAENQGSKRSVFHDGISNLLTRKNQPKSMGKGNNRTIWGRKPPFSNRSRRKL
jgi:hypothetical protein